MYSKFLVCCHTLYLSKCHNTWLLFRVAGVPLEICLNDLDSSSLEQIIEFCYTSSICVSEDNVWTVLPTATRLQVIIHQLYTHTYSYSHTHTHIHIQAFKKCANKYMSVENMTVICELVYTPSHTHIQSCSHIILTHTRTQTQSFSIR